MAKILSLDIKNFMEKNILNKLTIRGFKSIRELTNFELGKLNVLVGANGSGKSNLISFFKMLTDMLDGNLDDYVRENGGISNILYNGRKTTQKMQFETQSSPLKYRFTIKPDTNEGFVLTDEAYCYPCEMNNWRVINNGHAINDRRNCNSNDKRYIYDTMKSWQIYHFHDTSATAPVRGWEIVEDNKKLRSNASNLAAFLLRLREDADDCYREILNVCKLVMPYFKDFLLNVKEFGKDKEIKKVSLSWRTKNSDFPMQSYHLSDGSIRFICLAVALLQSNPPSMLIIDEPELGLHPEAIRIIGELINNAKKQTQIIVATQSPLLIDQFAIKDIVTVIRKDDQSVFERLKQKDFKKWLENYSLGELWTKNVLNSSRLNLC
ncbi:MAG: AAA family ATPase [Planctomycetaceae bacterium]|jgi:predicted ATPase|nr:AAA family ATPase [Planctomycetaceae bacterium]